MGGGAAPVQARPRITLVVDDNPHVRRILCEELLSAGFAACVEAENGARALTEAAKVKPDLIILDLAMPVLNGLEAAPLLRQLLPETPIILYTLYDQTVTPKEASALGISLVVSKADALETLISKARGLLSR